VCNLHRNPTNALSAFLGFSVDGLQTEALGVANNIDVVSAACATGSLMDCIKCNI
jgi:hypothetical protein